jgi:hypothetical protein
MPVTCNADCAVVLRPNHLPANSNYLLHFCTRCFLGLTLGVAGRYEEARPNMEEAIRIFEALGADGNFGLVVSLCFLGEIALPQSDFTLARPLFEHGIAVCRAANLRAAISPALGDFVMACLGMGDIEGARWCLRNEVDWEGKAAWMAQLFYLLTVTALTLIQSNQPAYAVEILSATTGLPLGDWEYDVRGKPVREALDMLRKRLPRGVYAAAWKRGQTPILLPHEELVPRRLTPEFRARVIWMLDQAGAPSAAEAITDREREVLACLARGLSNEQIADELVISVGTAKVKCGWIPGQI